MLLTVMGVPCGLMRVETGYMANFKTSFMNPDLRSRDILALDVILCVTLAAGFAQAYDARWAAFPVMLAASLWPFPVVLISQWRGLTTDKEYMSSSMRLWVGALIGAVVLAFALSRDPGFEWAALVLAASGFIHLVLDYKVHDKPSWTRNVLALSVGVIGASVPNAIAANTYRIGWTELAFGFYGLSVSFATRFPVAGDVDNR